MRVVVAMIEAPVPFGKAVARWYYVLLKELVARGHRVTAFAACGDPRQMAEAKALFPAPAYDLRLYAFPERRGWRSKCETLRRPHSYMFSAALRADLDRELAAGFDVLHLEELWAGWLGLRYADKALVNVFYLACIDQALARPSTWRGRLDRWLMLSAERRLIRRLKHFRVSSPRLVPEILRLNPGADVAVAPFGIDAGLYAYAPDARRTGDPVVTLIGSMGWSPSASAAVRLVTRLWPEIKRRVPAARLQIVGWSARSVLADYLHLPDVAIEENVPDARPYFEATAVFVYAPARGSGVKVKVLEALAYGVPVVTTTEGVEGLAATDGVEAGVADDDAGLIDRTVALLENPAAQNRQRAAGRRLVESRYGPTPTVDALEAIYARVLKPPGVA